MSKVSLEIMEPRGVLKDSKRVGLSVPRLDTLDGKTIALMSINIPGRYGASADPFYDVLERKLLARYPTANFLRMDSFGTPVAPPSRATEVAAQCDKRAMFQMCGNIFTQPFGRRFIGQRNIIAHINIL